MQLVQRGGDRQTQLIQPCLVDHAELRDGEDAVILLLADAGGAHLFAGGQTVDAAIVHGDGGADLRMLLENLGQVGHIFLGQIGGQVDEGAILAVGGQVVVVEAHAHEGVRQLAARDAHVDLLGKGIAHAVPLDGNAVVLLHFIEDFVVVVAAGQRGDAAHDFKIGLVGVGVGHARLGLGSGGFAAAGAEARGHAGGQRQRGDAFETGFHTRILLL